MKTEVLRLLRDSKDYLSGQKLSAELGISRAAIWKNIRSLREAGYQIEAVQNRGYRIREIPDTILPSEIMSRLGNTTLGYKVHFQKEISSTNVWAKRLGGEGAPAGTLVIADMQTAGRGRRGRTWVSPQGTDIYMSLLLRPDIPPAKSPMLTLVMGISVIQGLDRALNIKPQIKWPNDIILGGKKIAGILTEMSAQVDYIEDVVIGVGINCNRDQFPEEISETASSLLVESGEKVSRAQIVAAVLECFDYNYHRFMQTADLGSLMEQYNELLVHRDQEVLILEPGRQYCAVARGINAAGELLVETADRELHRVFSGEVSLRGRQGYI